MTEQPTTLTVAQVADRGSAVLDEVATLVVGMREPAQGRARGRPRRRARAVRGRARTGQDAGRPEPGDRAGARRSGGCSARPTCCRRTSPGRASSTRRRRRSRSGPGPVFAGLLLADEINRTAPKTQSALLEAMAERQVTVDGETYPLPDPFHVVATSNPVEYEGTYPLPEAQLDRFMVRRRGRLPRARRRGRRAVAAARAAAGDGVGADRRRRRRRCARCRPASRPSRSTPTSCGTASTSPRPPGRTTRSRSAPRRAGRRRCVLVARSLAVLSGRDFVTPEDVKAVAVPALAHRLSLTPQAWATGAAPQGVVADVLTRVAGPTTARRRMTWAALARDGRRGRRRPRAGRARARCSGARTSPCSARRRWSPGCWDWRRRPSVDADRAAGGVGRAAGRGDAAGRRRGRRRPRDACSSGSAAARASCSRRGCSSTAPGASRSSCTPSAPGRRRSPSSTCRASDPAPRACPSPARPPSRSALVLPAAAPARRPAAARRGCAG